MGSSTDRVKSKTIKLLFAASLALRNVSELGDTSTRGLLFQCASTKKTKSNLNLVIFFFLIISLEFPATSHYIVDSFDTTSTSNTMFQEILFVQKGVPVTVLGLGKDVMLVEVSQEVKRIINVSNKYISLEIASHSVV